MNAIASKAVKAIVRVNEVSKAPTLQQYSAYQASWEYFNNALFGGELRPCLLNFSRASKAYGFFWAKKWGKLVDGKAEYTHEISLNPDLLHLPMKEIMSTLVHEMAHQWQQDHGQAPRKCYHDRQWAQKMIELGLYPSDTGAEGGKTTGQKMSHYIVKGGAFEVAFTKMNEALILPWRSAGQVEVEKEKKEKQRASKTKYTCPSCEANAWGKPDLHIVCGDCGEEFKAEEKEETGDE